MDHDSAQGLLGAAALESLPASEREALNLHLESCAECRGDLEELATTASLLASDHEMPAPAVWDRIEAQLGAAPPPIRLVRPRSRTLVASWAAAAAVVLVVASSLITARVMDDNTPNVASEQQLAQEALKLTGSRSAVLLDTSNQPVADVVLPPDGRVFLVNRSLPQLPQERTYQLWAMHDGKPISIGLLGSSPTASDFLVGSTASALAISDERAEGVTSPSAAPIASVRLTT